ncbi:MAG: VWA domain-containing protein [Phycisphaerae bacterium]|nr:VWA domain-containing protein [Phycisphaerae bacterium]
MMQFVRGEDSHQRRGVVFVLTVVMLVVLCGFAALTIDTGMLYNVRADLQRTADAAALAAAGRLADAGNGNILHEAQRAAEEVVAQNSIFGKKLSFDAKTDLTFGVARYSESKAAYDFVPTSNLPDAVRVRLVMAEGSANGPVPLLFARIFGRHSANVSAEAIALMTPRDVALVADLSSSLNDDSELQNYDKTPINLYDVWAALPDPPKGNNGVGNGLDAPPPGNPLSVNDGESTAPGSPGNQGGNPTPGADPTGKLDGPAWGYMMGLGFGDELMPEEYDPTTDPGLVYLPYRSNWSDAGLTQYLRDRGYAASEVSAILAGSYDGNGSYPYRTAVALGLAYWNSGISGGLWSVRSAPSGNGDARIDAGELQWAQPIMNYTIDESRSIWLDWINRYVSSSRTAMAGADSDFRYRYGLKTFTNYLLESRTGHTVTPELADVPAQPMQAIKDAVGFLVELLDGLDAPDQLSLEGFGETGTHEIDLTTDFFEASARLNAMQPGEYVGWTNTGAGLERAIEELTSNRARPTARKLIVLLTDGLANVSATGRTGDTAGGAAYAREQARRAAELGIQIFTISVGSGADQVLMKEIAEIGHGQHFHAEGTIEDYSQGLAAIFTRIGVTRSVDLIQ